jgi:putative phosphoribosyl transferase
MSMVGDYPTPLFRDRADAGRQLAKSVQKLTLGDVVVLAIPSGGVPAGAELAKALGAPLDLMIARKVQFPWSTEAGFGAVVSDGTVYVGPYGATLPQSVVRAQIEKAKRQVQHRVKEFLGDRPPLDVAGKDVILVDDGLATGSTMLAAVQSLRCSCSSRTWTSWWPSTSIQRTCPLPWPLPTRAGTTSRTMK